MFYRTISVLVKSNTFIELIAFETIIWLKFGEISLQIGGNISVTRPLNFISSNSFEQSSTITEIV